MAAVVDATAAGQPGMVVLERDLTVTDTQQSGSAVSRDALGVSAAAITDNQALATCP